MMKLQLTALFNCPSWKAPLFMIILCQWEQSGDLELTNNSLFKRNPSLTKSPSHSPPPTPQHEAFKSRLKWQRVTSWFTKHLPFCAWWHIHYNPGACKSWKLDLCNCDGTNRWVSCAFPWWLLLQDGLEWKILKHERSQCCLSPQKQSCHGRIDKWRQE